ncbi:Hypothetical predicted protein [Paramuricea clavata]|uniref:Integrase core domain-containing protein n=1 Tax=Paramuricea clavata TaxID=317549 RepID=A0A6S7IIV3_PARCT|nr:Hypothetical predicted protein [Paramuricea clavata]
MFLSCSTNNQASTVLDYFLEAVGQFGLPQRVRQDQGVENVDVARYMFAHPRRGPNRGSYISGKSNGEDEYGIDWDGPCPVGDAERVVIVPETRNPLNDEMNEQLMRRINPLGPSDDFGTNIYNACVNLVTHLLGQVNG